MQNLKYKSDLKRLEKQNIYIILIHDLNKK